MHVLGLSRPRPIQMREAGHLFDGRMSDRRRAHVSPMHCASCRDRVELCPAMLASSTRGGAAWRIIKDHHIARAAARAAQAAFQPRKRKCPAPRPDQRLHVEFLAVITFATRLRTRPLRAAIGATDGDAPTLRTGFAERLRSPSQSLGPQLVTLHSSRLDFLYANLFDVEKSGMDAEQGLDFREQKENNPPSESRRQS